jgi:hypothetical protein
VGLITEQAWDLPDLAASAFGTDPTIASIGFRNGKPAGSASALTWSAGQFVRLMLDVSAGAVLDRPAYTVDRYIRNTQRATTLTVTAPADRSAATDSTRVQGTTPAGNTVIVDAVNLDDHTAITRKPGAYDLQRFEVYDAGDRIIFRVRTRDLTPTFGSPLGAQLVDVYVRVPGASPTSTAAAFPQRNYTVAAGWSKRLEVQGFGQQYVDAGGATLGQVNISANDISRFITFSVSKASLGTPATGWAFTVVLTGQDGFSSDQARGFQPTPQDFQFGVCATASSDPHCTFPAGNVPKAMDVIGGAAQLDYTLHAPVEIAPVVIP